MNPCRANIKAYNKGCDPHPKKHWGVRVILISNYMIKKYGVQQAIDRMLKYKYKYSGGFYK